jgi:hypothetical protein
MRVGLSGSRLSRHFSASIEGYVGCQKGLEAHIWGSWLKKMMRGGPAGTREVQSVKAMVALAAHPQKR